MREDEGDRIGRMRGTGYIMKAHTSNRGAARFKFLAVLDLWVDVTCPCQ